MQTVECPHCHKGVRFVGPGELEREYSLKPNSVAHYKSTGRFPEAVLTYQKAHVYLEDDILRFKVDKINRELGGVVDRLMDDMKNLTPEDRARARKMLEERLDGNGPPGGRRRAAPKKASTPRRKKGGRDSA